MRERRRFASHGTVLRGAPVLATILPHDSRSVAVDNAGAKTKARRDLRKPRPKDAAGSRELIAFANGARSVFAARRNAGRPILNAVNHENRVAGPRLVAIVGPFQSGKTSLLEGILLRGGAVARQGSVREGTSVGDSSSEARSHAMSVEPNVASIDYLGDRLTFFDCPGSIEFIHDMRYALPVCDAAVVVCEADPRKVPALQVILARTRRPWTAAHPLPQQNRSGDRKPARDARDAAAGLARAAAVAPDPGVGEWARHWVRRSRARAGLRLPRGRAVERHRDASRRRAGGKTGALSDAREARRLRRRADGAIDQRHRPAEGPRLRRSRARIARGPGRAGAAGLGDRGHGVTRLLKALRHESPGIAHTRKRLGIEDKGPALAQVVRTIHTAHGGKLSLARVLRGAFADGATVVNSRGVEERIGGLARLMGAMSSKLTRAEEGDTIAFARLEDLATGDRFAEGRTAPAPGATPRRSAPDPGRRHSRQGPQGRSAACQRARQALRGGSRALLLSRTPRCPN